MFQASQTSKAKMSYNCHCGNPATLRTSHTDTNPGRQFFNCAVGYAHFLGGLKMNHQRVAHQIFKALPNLKY